MKKTYDAEEAFRFKKAGNTISARPRGTLVRVLAFSRDRSRIKVTREYSETADEMIYEVDPQAAFYISTYDEYRERKEKEVTKVKAMRKKYYNDEREY